MHGPSRLGNGVASQANTPASRRTKIPSATPPPKAPSVSAAVKVILTATLRRKGILLVVPLIYVIGMVVFMGYLNIDYTMPLVSVRIVRRLPPGSVYKSNEVFRKLLPFLESDSNHTISLANAWHQKASQKWKPCIERKLSHSVELPPSNGFLIIEANGGLNQQRLSICDAVAVASLLNATLVVPFFHFNSVWRDSSKFGDIFDEEYFIERLKHHVRIVKEVPFELLQRFDNNMSNIINMRTKAHASKTYYVQKVLPKLLELGAVRIAPFSNRLAHSVPPYMQALRCLTNYEALRFSEPIRSLAENMVQRMVKNSSFSGGKYISVHLRFEEDMVAFSCCTYDGGYKEKHEMDKARERSWRGKFKRPHKQITPEENRKSGRCPLTPLEVGMMLRGMGFDNHTSVYIASGKIYNADKYMAPLRRLFPLLETKETLASEHELAAFKNYSSRLAALDYTVCAHSEVFLTTQGGNFPHFLIGHRRFLYEGHSKTIKPDKKRLVLAFDNPNIRWDKFKRNMQEVLHQSDTKGIALRKSDASLYTFPMPDCMCQQ